MLLTEGDDQVKASMPGSQQLSLQRAAVIKSSRYLQTEPSFVGLASLAQSLLKGRSPLLKGRSTLLQGRSTSLVQAMHVQNYSDLKGRCVRSAQRFYWMHTMVVGDAQTAVVQVRVPRRAWLGWVAVGGDAGSAVVQ